MQPSQFRFAFFIGILAVIFTVAINAAAVTEKVLYTFHGTGDGSLPSSNLIFDKAGNLYGVTSAGGSAACDSSYGIFGCGTVFEISPNSNGTWTETVLYSFQGGSDGIQPGNIVFDKAGIYMARLGEAGPKRASKVAARSSSCRARMEFGLRPFFTDFKAAATAMRLLA